MTHLARRSGSELPSITVVLKLTLHFIQLYVKIVNLVNSVTSEFSEPTFFISCQDIVCLRFEVFVLVKIEVDVS
jgi:hypothetical protein